VMQKLMDERYPVYANADATVVTRQERKEVIADEVVMALCALLGLEGSEASVAEERQ
jgi:shikimate kinase